MENRASTYLIIVLVSMLYQGVTNDCMECNCPGDKLKALIEAKLADRTTAEWETLLIPAGVPCSAINNVAELKKRHPEVFVTASSTLCVQVPVLNKH